MPAGAEGWLGEVNAYGWPLRFGVLVDEDESEMTMVRHFEQLDQARQYYESVSTQADHHEEWSVINLFRNSEAGTMPTRENGLLIEEWCREDDAGESLPIPLLSDPCSKLCSGRRLGGRRRGR